jgi:hypothetical protein
MGGAARGEAQWHAVLTAEAALAIRDEHVKGATVRELAVKFGAHDTTVRRVLEGRSWVHVTGGSNILRRTRHGAYRAARAALTYRQVRTLRTYARLYPTISGETWASLLSVSPAAVYDILRGWSYRDGAE